MELDTTCPMCNGETGQLGICCNVRRCRKCAITFVIGKAGDKWITRLDGDSWRKPKQDDCKECIKFHLNLTASVPKLKNRQFRCDVDRIG